MNQIEKSLIFLEAAKQALLQSGVCKQAAVEEIDKLIKDLKEGRVSPQVAESRASAIEEASHDLPTQHGREWVH